MQVTINLPEELIRYLGKDATELSHAAIEALVLEGVRSGKLSVAQGRRVLGFPSRHQMETDEGAHRGADGRPPAAVTAADPDSRSPWRGLAHGLPRPTCSGMRLGRGIRR